MKYLKTIVVGFGIMVSTAVADPVTNSYTFSDGFLDGGVIPDGNVTGWSDTRTISDWAPGFTITDVKVSLQINGGFNGDLYAYLTHESGYSILLNRPGKTASNPFGYSDAGFNITLDDNAVTDIHLYGGNSGNPLAGSWQPDGRFFDPAIVLDTTPRSAPLSSFQGFEPLGAWALVMMDMSGGGQSTLGFWSMDITAMAVPEPNTFVLGLAAMGVIGFAIRRKRGSTRNPGN